MTVRQGTMAQPSICIIGGGIGGVATAVALRRLGVAADVYERAPKVGEVGSGLSLWPNATRALRDMGLLEELKAKSGDATHFLVRREDGRVLMDLELGGFEVPALCTHRADLLSVMLDHVPAESIHLGHELEALVEAGGRLRVRFKNGQERECDAVIGADGIRSRVRASLFGEAEPVFRGYTISRGVGFYSGSNMPAQHNSETWGPGKRFGILAMGAGRFTWYGTTNLGRTIRPTGWSTDPGARKQELLSAFADWHEPIPQLIASTPAESILRNDAHDRTPLRHWGKGAVTLLGDAAHPLTPNLGQGGCLAIEDAWTLANCVRASSDMPHAFRAYEALREPRTRHLTERSLLLGWVGQWEHPVLVSCRQQVTRMLPARLFERNLKRIYSYEVKA